MRTVLILFILFSCSPKKNGPEVKIAGELRKIMMENNTAASIDLDEIASRQNLYALGAVENLNGEILIWNNKPFISHVIGNTFATDTSYEAKAALLVYAEVPEWINFSVPTDLTRDELDSFLANLAEENHLGQPFPFLLRGNAEELKWHVVAPGADHSHTNAGYNGVDADKEVDALGFYSTNHKGIFTHHDSNMHLHFRFQNSTNAGHVDDLIIKNGSIVSLPKLL